MGDSEFRLYNPDADLFGADGYPAAWHDLKHLVREQAAHRCVRCGHPFVVGETPGEWSPCDEGCYHGVVRMREVYRAAAPSKTASTTPSR